MKHIIRFHIFEAWKPKEFDPIQQEFVQKFLAKCEEIGISVQNKATELQKKNNTWIINLPISDVLKLFLESGWQQYLTGIRKGKAERLMKGPLFKMAEPALANMKVPREGTAHWIIANNNVRQMIKAWHGASAATHSSQRNIVFSELENSDQALGLFYSQLALVIYNQLTNIRYGLENGNTDWLLTYKFFDALSIGQVGELMKKYPSLNWNEVFSKADLPQSTFKEIVSSPDFSNELKQRVFNNPNYADYDKVEDVLGDW